MIMINLFELNYSTKNQDDPQGKKQSPSRSQKNDEKESINIPDFVILYTTGCHVSLAQSCHA